jgi:glycosyltransferase-like protein
MIDTSPRLRVAILTHSTNARGGVMHALELADALTRLGHAAVVHAPDPSGKGFFRRTEAPTISVPASPTGSDVTAMVETRVADYVRYFESPPHRRFDVFHAQDGISGNALATLKQRGLIHGFARTVHHMDSFGAPRLQALQHRSISAADQLLVVSRMWADRLAADFSELATVIGNGVDISRFSPRASANDMALRERLGIRGGPVLLCVGGVEERKNTIRMLEAFRQLRAIRPSAQLVIAGGASVLDHRTYHRQFRTALDSSGLPCGAVIHTGVLADADMPPLYRLANALVFASVREGFGLAVLEAMASGLPVIASRIPPFTEYLTDEDVVWCDPLSTGSIANAMATVLAEPLHSLLSANGHRVARRHDWLRTARAHLPVYASMLEMHHA